MGPNTFVNPSKAVKIHINTHTDIFVLQPNNISTSLSVSIALMTLLYYSSLDKEARSVGRSLEQRTNALGRGYFASS